MRSQHPHFRGWRQSRAWHQALDFSPCLRKGVEQPLRPAPWQRRKGWPACSPRLAVYLPRRHLPPPPPAATSAVVMRHLRHCAAFRLPPISLLGSVDAF